MNFPIQWGLPQYALLLIAFVGFVLIVLFLASFKSVKYREELQDETGRKFYRHRRRRRPRLHYGFGGAFLLVAGLLLLGISGALQEYLGLTGTILVAHVRAVQAQSTSNIPMMSVELVLYDQNGNKSSDKTYIVNGDEVFIQGDIVEIPSWLNIIGFHSGYKLIKLEGMYSDVNLEEHSQHTVVVLNGGDDSLFNTAYHKGITAFYVTAAYKNGSSVPTNGVGYNICASQDALIARPDTQSC